MLRKVALCFALCVASSAGQWQTLEIVPQSAIRTIQPRRGARAGPFRVTPRQQMLSCGHRPAAFLIGWRRIGDEKDQGGVLTCGGLSCGARDGWGKAERL